MPTQLTTGDLVSAANWNTIPIGLLGYTQVTSGQGSISTEVDLTGLTVTITAGTSRRIRISAETSWSATNSDNVVVVRIKESTTTLQTARTVIVVGSSTREMSLPTSIVITPSAGSHTYKLSAEMATGTGSISSRASATQVAWIAIEDIGPV